MRKIAAAVSLVVAVAGVAVPSVVRAQSIIRAPGDHPDYHFDIEPHGVLGFWFWDGGAYGGVGFGGGVRVSMPVCKNCFIPRINNNVAISFGADLVSWPFGNQQGLVPSDFYFPVAMQWNFFLTRRWSVAGEVGFAPIVGVFYDETRCGNGCHNWGIWPVVGAVGRFHFNDRIALTMRLEFPEGFNIGVSFLL